MIKEKIPKLSIEDIQRHFDASRVSERYRFPKILHSREIMLIRCLILFCMNHT